MIFVSAFNLCLGTLCVKRPESRISSPGESTGFLCPAASSVRVIQEHLGHAAVPATHDY